MHEIVRVRGHGPILRVLHLHLEVGEQSEANQFLYPARHQVSVATFFPCRITFPDSIPLFDGDGTFSGFRHALRAAEDRGPYDIVHAHGPIDGMLYWLFCHAVGRRLGRTVGGVHNSHENFKLRNRVLFHGIFALFDRIVCVSQASLESFPSRFHRLGRGRLSAVRNGVDLGRLDRAVAAVERERDDRRFQVASVGRLIDIKNPFALLRAFEGIEDPDARLVYMGNGVLEEPLRASAADDPRVSLRGEVPREEVFRSLYRSADLYVSASRGEGLPMAPLEAMASGCPVILSDIAPHREIAEGSDFIPLVDPDDTAGFRREIGRFRDMGSEARRSVGARCRRVVEEKFSLQAMHDGYDRVYYDLLGMDASVAAEPSAASELVAERSADPARKG